MKIIAIFNVLDAVSGTTVFMFTLCNFLQNLIFNVRYKAGETLDLVDLDVCKRYNSIYKYIYIFF